MPVFNCDYANLKYDNRDIGYMFRRVGWSEEVYFMWNKTRQEYIYMNNSQVGIGVLHSDELMKFKIKPKKEIKMRNVNYIGTGYEVVEVTYEITNPESLEHRYFFKTDIKLQKGDLVVVESSNGLGLCRVVSDSVPRSLESSVIKMYNKAKAWVVDTVNTTNQDKRQIATERKKFIMEQLEERKEAMEEKAIYNVLAQSDPEAKKLLEELESIDVIIIEDK